MAQKTVKKDDVKEEVKVCKKMVDALPTWEESDFIDSSEKNSCVFRGQVLENGAWVEVNYGADFTKTGNAEKEQIGNALKGFTKINQFKKYDVKSNKIDWLVIEVKPNGNAIGMYVFRKRDGKLIYGNICKRLIEQEIAIILNETYNNAKNLLAKCAGRGDARGSKLYNESKKVELINDYEY